MINGLDHYYIFAINELSYTLNMKKILVAFLLVFSLASVSAQLKLDDWGYFRSSDLVELRIIPFVSVNVPGDMGFRLPVAENAFAESNGQILFKLNPKLLEDGHAANFQFEYKHGDPSLYLKIMEYPEGVKDFLSENPKGDISEFMKTQMGENETIIDSQLSALGSSVSILVGDGNSSFEVHQFFYKNYWYMFMFETKVTTDQRKTYEGIIRSIKSLNKK